MSDRTQRGARVLASNGQPLRPSGLAQHIIQPPRLDGVQLSVKRSQRYLLSTCFAKRLLLGFFLTEVGFGASSTVNANVVQPPSDRPAGGHCFGKTLKELRAAGRVMEFKRTQ